ncbi:hypothetical protein DIPPA_34784 [Diplonema papillatum]|nr:hypothetical protein DIPPA_34784 [Diplonema papillatum]
MARRPHPKTAALAVLIGLACLAAGCETGGDCAADEWCSACGGGRAGVCKRRVGAGAACGGGPGVACAAAAACGRGLVCVAAAGGRVPAGPGVCRAPGGAIVHPTDAVVGGPGVPLRACGSDAECGADEWCRLRAAANGQCMEAFKVCTPRSEVGEPCGGALSGCRRHRCQRHLVCLYGDGGAGAPGTCQPPTVMPPPSPPAVLQGLRGGCLSDADCAEMEWCRPAAAGVVACSPHHKTCAPRSAVGSPCGGRAEACTRAVCAAGLVCRHTREDPRTGDGDVDVLGTCSAPEGGGDPQEQPSVGRFRLKACGGDADCPPAQHCRAAVEADGLCSSSVWTCVDRVPEGSPCAGLALACRRGVCARGLVCVGDDPLSERPGVCKSRASAFAPTPQLLQCGADDECAAGQACDPAPLPDGSCTPTRVCAPLAPVGGACGNGSLPCFSRRCLPGLVCGPLGRCQVPAAGGADPASGLPCLDDADCGAGGRYCAREAAGPGGNCTAGPWYCVRRLGEGEYCRGRAGTCGDAKCLEGLECGGQGVCVVAAAEPRGVDGLHEARQRCLANSDCPAGEHCRQRRNSDGTCSAARACVPRRGAGERCAHGPVECRVRLCARGLVCVFRPDATGTGDCRVPEEAAAAVDAFLPPAEEGWPAPLPAGAAALFRRGCSEDGDCAADQYCGAAPEAGGGCPARTRECAARAGPGQRCGGGMLACSYLPCQSGLVCVHVSSAGGGTATEARYGFGECQAADGSALRNDVDDQVGGWEQQLPYARQCSVDSDCEPNESCGAEIHFDGSCSDASFCMQRAGLGEPCGGYFVDRCSRRKCENMLVCVYGSPELSSPGTCQLAAHNAGVSGAALAVEAPPMARVCTDGSDCAPGEFCRPAPAASADHPCASFSICVARAAPGEACGGDVFPCARGSCAAGLSCVYATASLQSPGVCSLPQGQVQPGVGACRGNADCGPDEFCRAAGAGDGTCPPSASECVKRAAYGDACGGDVPPCYRKVCAPDLVCVYSDPLLVVPGTCRTPARAGSPRFAVGVFRRVDSAVIAVRHGCIGHADCGAAEHCRHRQRADGSCSPVKVCMPRVAEGEPCGASALACYGSLCKAGLACVVSSADEPGVCRVAPSRGAAEVDMYTFDTSQVLAMADGSTDPVLLQGCTNDDDCGESEWCREYRLEDGTCASVKTCVVRSSIGGACEGYRGLSACEADACEARLVCDAGVCRRPTAEEAAPVPAVFIVGNPSCAADGDCAPTEFCRPMQVSDGGCSSATWGCVTKSQLGARCSEAAALCHRIECADGLICELDEGVCVDPAAQDERAEHHGNGSRMAVTVFAFLPGLLVCVGCAVLVFWHGRVPAPARRKSTEPTKEDPRPVGSDASLAGSANLPFGGPPGSDYSLSSPAHVPYGGPPGSDNCSPTSSVNLLLGVHFGSAFSPTGSNNVQFPENVFSPMGSSSIRFPRESAFSPTGSDVVLIQGPNPLASGQESPRGR